MESKLVYEGLHQYALDNKFGPKYLVKAKAYQDSLFSILDLGSYDYLLEKGLIYLQEGNLQKATETYQDLCFNRLEPSTSIYARATATLASIYAKKREKDYPQPIYKQKYTPILCKKILPLRFTFNMPLLLFNIVS